MILHIRNMVSDRCKMIVKSDLEKLGLPHIRLELGLVELGDNITAEQYNLLDLNLRNSGLSIIEDKKSILIENIKIVVIELIHYSTEALKVNFSTYLSDRLQHDYTYLSNLFAENEHVTIEHFLISHRIERIKELLIYDEMNINEISYLMHYSSAAHLSNQFKKMTGLTPSQFKHLRLRRRITLDKV
ncbi:MAG: helix-turn-helix transcriptional regulator [Bacteroidales bacterium]|nr:helix-turn-helix transcriptional regulator [Bacteroidales bacterium]